MKLLSTLALCIALLPACKKKKDQPATETTKVEMAKNEGSGSAMGSATTGSAAATGSGSAPASAGGGGCVDGAYKDPEGFYCIKLPEGYKSTTTLAVTDDDHIVDSFATEDNQFFQVTVWKKGMTWDNMKGTMAQHIEGNTPTESTESDGGNAYWVKNPLVKSKQTATGYAIKSGDKIIECWSLANDATPLNPPDACKTLRAL
jgi:hypothetical protein